MRHCSLVLVSLFFLTAVNTLGQDLTSGEQYSQRGMARFERNELDGAIADFTRAIELNGPNPEFCYYFRGIARYRRGNLDEAIADLGKAINIKRHPRFYDDRGNLLAKKGDLDGAMTDLNSAIEIAPKYAKAYGDRGIVRLMRGEDTQAESDFKKCFELDSTLEGQIRTAAGHMRQRAFFTRDYELPADVKVIKFKWGEEPVSVLTGEPSPVSVTSTPVSQTGTRVLANPQAKGDPGPGVVVDRAAAPPSAREIGTNTRTHIEDKFSVSLENIGNKTIVGVQWGYFFNPKDKAPEAMGLVFSTRTNIAPGKEKNISELASASAGSYRAPLPSKKTRTLFNERIVILRLTYADGTTWQGLKHPLP